MIVNVKQGSLCGKKSFTVLNKKPYMSYSGIPYAMVPTADLRFQAPKPIYRWNGVYDAKHERGPCIQKSLALKKIIGCEDCLYLNVYVPETNYPINKLKAVMVYIHGGGFCNGSATSAVYGPDFLLDHYVIVVTINYRLQILGFLNLGIPECPGNAGLKDQVMALRWIKENIINFGGDPNNITLFGESAGATCAHFLAISPLSRGLFHKVILQSGFCMSSWSITSDPIEIAFEIGRRLGYFGSDRVELLNHLKTQPAKDLIEAGNQLREERIGLHTQGTTLFAPSIECIREGAIISEHPNVMFRTAPPMPMIWGSTDLEGLFGIGLMSKTNLEIVLNDISILLRKYFNIDPNQLSDKAGQIASYYFHNSHSREAKLQSLANLFTDIFFYQLQDSLDFLGDSSFPPFVYEFCYSGKMNVMKKMFSLKLNCKFQGACHSDDVHYLFHHKSILPGRGFDRTDLKVVSEMCSMWTNFAKLGNPSHQLWRPYTKDNPSHLRIDADLQAVHGPIRGIRPQILKNILGPYSMKSLSSWDF